MGEAGIIAALVNPAVWPVAIIASSSTLALTITLQKLSDWCEASALGVTVGEWRDLNRARLRALTAARAAIRNRPSSDGDEAEWAAPREKNLLQGVPGVPITRVLGPPAPAPLPECRVPHPSPEPVEVRSRAREAPPGRANAGPEFQHSGTQRLQTDSNSCVAAHPPPKRESQSSSVHGRVQMGAVDQIREFLDDFAFRRMSGKKELRQRGEDWFAAYAAWAEHGAIVPVPEWTFYGVLRKADGVVKSRQRLRDPATGRCAHNDNGTPLRGYFYKFTKPRRTSVPAAARANSGQHSEFGLAA